MDLNIKYQNGSMTVHLEEFLDCRSIGKVKKLLKVIRDSYTPYEEQKLKDFIEQEIEQFEPKQMEDHKYIIGYEEKVKFCQKQLNNCIANRSNFKRNSDPWKHYNSYVKQFREELRDIKKLLSSRRSDLNRCIRNKQFYIKCLENIT